MKILITEFMDVEYVELLKANFDVMVDHDLSTNISELKKIANENNVHAIIFGNPKNMDSHDSLKANGSGKSWKSLNFHDNPRISMFSIGIDENIPQNPPH